MKTHCHYNYCTLTSQELLGQSENFNENNSHIEPESIRHWVNYLQPAFKLTAGYLLAHINFLTIINI